MSLHRKNPKRDSNEREIVEALEARGCEVTRISGRGAPDLLVRRRERLWAFEVKALKGRLTDAQRESRWPVVRCVEDALTAIGETWI